MVNTAHDLNVGKCETQNYNATQKCLNNISKTNENVTNTVRSQMILT